MIPAGRKSLHDCWLLLYSVSNMRANQSHYSVDINSSYASMKPYRPYPGPMHRLSFHEHNTIHMLSAYEAFCSKHNCSDKLAAVAQNTTYMFLLEWLKKIKSETLQTQPFTHMHVCMLVYMRRRRHTDREVLGRSCVTGAAALTAPNTATYYIQQKAHCRFCRRCFRTQTISKTTPSALTMSVQVGGSEGS